MFKLKDTVYFVKNNKIHYGTVLGLKNVEFVPNCTKLSDDTYYGVMRAGVGDRAERYVVYDPVALELFMLPREDVFATKEALVQHLVG